MSNEKMAGYVLYAIGIIGGVEGTEIRGMDRSLGIITSVIALVVIIIASYLITKK